jgi:hypothetical protein
MGMGMGVGVSSQVGSSKRRSQSRETEGMVGRVAQVAYHAEKQRQEQAVQRRGRVLVMGRPEEVLWLVGLKPNSNSSSRHAAVAAEKKKAVARGPNPTAVAVVAMMMVVVVEVLVKMLVLS